jgi:hypothetical protein
MPSTARLAFDTWPSGITAADVPANNNVQRLDATLNAYVKSASTAAQPGSPTNGDVYILPASPTGAQWAGKATGTIAYFDTSWYFFTPYAGMRARVEDTGAYIRFNAGAWGYETDSLIAATAGINTTETVVDSIVLPVNALKVGSTIRIKASGVCTSTVANASNFRFRIGATTLTGAIASVVTPTAAASGTNIPFSVELLVTVRTIGASGTAIGSGTLLNNGVTGVSAAAVVVNQVTTAVTIDTTTALRLELTYQAAAATTTCTFHNALIEIVRG